MTTHPKTSFDQYFEKQMEDPAFAEGYAKARREIDAIDNLIRALDDQRIDYGLTKAELARRADVNPEMVRRLFSAHGNPTVRTLLKLVTALGCQLEIVPNELLSKKGQAA